MDTFEDCVMLKQPSILGSRFDQAALELREQAAKFGTCFRITDGGVIVETWVAERLKNGGSLLSPLTEVETIRRWGH